MCPQECECGIEKNTVKIKDNISYKLVKFNFFMNGGVLTN